METDRYIQSHSLANRALDRLRPKQIVLLLIIVIAAFLRMWSLDENPPGLHHDEAYNGLDARALLERETFPIFHEGWELYSEQVYGQSAVFQTKFPVFFEGNYGREPLFVYLSAALIFLIGPTSVAIRSTSAIAGVLSVITVYLAASILTARLQNGGENRPKITKEILQDFTPLIAAFFTAILYPALTFSRLGFRTMIFVPLSAWAVYAFWQGIEKSELVEKQTVESALPLPANSRGSFVPRWFILAGLITGLGIYAYAAGRFLPLVFAGYVLYWFISERGAIRKQWANILVMTLSALAVTLPLLIFWGRHPYYLIYRSRVIANRGEGTYPGRPWITWALNVTRALRGLVWRGDTNIAHNLPGRPFLDPLQVILFVFGLVASIIDRFKRRDVFLIIWLVVMLLPDILTGDAPHFGRLIGIVPPIVILMARGTIWIGQILLEVGSGYRFIRPQFIVGLLMAFLIISGVLTINDYFRRLPREAELADAFFKDDWQLGQYAKELPNDSMVYLVPTQEKMATLYFAFGGDESRLRSFYSPAETLLPLGKPGQGTYYLVRPWIENTVARLASQLGFERLGQTADGSWAFSGGKISEELSEDPSYSTTWGGAIALREIAATRQANILSVLLTWQSLVEMERSYTAFVHLLAEDGTLISQLDRIPDGYPTNDWQRDEVIVDRYDLVLPSDLEQGTYFIQTGFYYLPTGERLGEPVVVASFEAE